MTTKPASITAVQEARLKYQLAKITFTDKCKSGTPALEALHDAVRKGIDALVVARGPDDGDVWDHNTAAEAVNGNLRAAYSKRGIAAWLRAPRRTATDEAHLLAAAIRWHKGNGSLYSSHPWAAGRKGSPASKADTLANLLLDIAGQKSRAVSAWRATGIFGGES